MSSIVILIMVALVSVQGLVTPQPEPVLSEGNKEILRGLVISSGSKTGEVLHNWVQVETDEMLKNWGISTGIRKLWKNWIMSTGSSTGELFVGLVKSTGATSANDVCHDCNKFLGDVETVVDSNSVATRIAVKASGACILFGESKTPCEEMITMITDMALGYIRPQFDDLKKLCVTLQYCTKSAPATWYQTDGR